MTRGRPSARQAERSAEGRELAHGARPICLSSACAAAEYRRCRCHSNLSLRLSAVTPNRRAGPRKCHRRGADPFRVAARGNFRRVVAVARFARRHECVDAAPSAPTSFHCAVAVPSDGARPASSATWRSPGVLLGGVRHGGRCPPRRSHPGRQSRARLTCLNGSPFTSLIISSCPCGTRCRQNDIRERPRGGIRAGRSGEGHVPSLRRAAGGCRVPGCPGGNASPRAARPCANATTASRSSSTNRPWRRAALHFSILPMASSSWQGKCGPGRWPGRRACAIRKPPGASHCGQLMA